MLVHDEASVVGGVRLTRAGRVELGASLAVGGGLEATYYDTDSGAGAAGGHIAGAAANYDVGEGAGIGDGNNNGVLAIPPCVEPGARSSTCTLGVSSTTRAPDMLDNVASRGLQGTPGVGRLAA